MTRNLHNGIIYLLLLLAISCKNESSSEPALFKEISSDQSNLHFSNDLDYLPDFNIYTYRNFYNGGGVAVGDINNDGLVDLLFTGNMRPNRLYLNRGDLSFDDITEQSGVSGTQSWSTGVTMADVNGDGWLDIYVCNSGDIEGDRKKNELFINSGDQSDGTIFTEQAEGYGLADQGYGTHAAFFDYDQDGDLDCYLLNNSYRSIFDFNLRKDQRPIRDELGGDKFFRNNGDNTFSEISEEAGIYGSEIGFGLGVTVGDVNRDGWLDIFVSNDFFERDYLYINQGDGTFLEDLENQIQSLSVASMGADLADLNNDGYPEIFVTEMLPENETRFKTKMTFESWDRYQFSLENGYYHQFTRNVLQLNNRDNTFSEVGRLAGVEATDWSWGALIADYDNDGKKDLFVSNGLYKDIIDQDYINFVSNEEIIKQMVTEHGVDYQTLIDTIPSTPISNYLFQQQDNLQFVDRARDWGLDKPSHSNGSAYADLDNDGDLDLIINNVNATASLFENRTEVVLPKHHFLKVILKGIAANPFATGANVTLRAEGQSFYLENIPTRGFQSSVDQRLNFGLGEITQIDSIIVHWPDRTYQILTDVQVDQTIEIERKEVIKIAPPEPRQMVQQFKNITNDQAWSFVHRENPFVDFDRDRLLYHMVSTEGPSVSVTDVNGDSLDDFFVGGAANQPAALFVQQNNGQFLSTNENLFLAEAGAEDLDSEFLDVDGDGDQDLYVARGGNEFLTSQNRMIDQLFINDGQGKFTRSAQFLPTFKPESSGCVRATDFDQDGDMDLFVGIRIVPGYYGLSSNGYILANDGRGQFKNVSPQIAEQMQQLGMVTDAIWIDYDQDQDEDLVVVGEWMPITFFKNSNGQFARDDKALDFSTTSGWWNCIKSEDLDGDGDLDLVVGNHGLNSRFQANSDEPISIYVNDFDGNGTPDPIITAYNQSQAYPTALRHDLVMQLPSLKKKYPSYHAYESQQFEDVFTEEQRKGSVVKRVQELRTSVLWNNGDGTFEIDPLPIQAQFAPIYAIHLSDIDQDGHCDILLGGNLYGVKPEVGRYDASYGLLLRGLGDHNFSPLSARQSGFELKGQVRDFETITVADKNHLLVARNNDSLLIFSY